VSLNGKIRRDPETPVSGKQDQIAIDGTVVKPQDKIYFMMNKPRGVVTTASDEKGRDTVYDALNICSSNRGPRDEARDETLPWVAPVGRLDKASEGLLLLTNDSEWGARIAAPETHLDKTYHVQVGTVADEKFLQAMVHGVKAKDGEVLRAKRARRLRAGEKNCWIEIVLDEGKNRQIRRMMEAIGVEVLRLIRIAVGPLQLGDLAKGKCRALTADEKRMLDRAMRGIL
jgi:23S rRNA pseudouridine2605 synthase